MSKQKITVKVFKGPQDPWPEAIAECELLGVNEDGFRVVLYRGTQYASPSGKDVKICMAYPVPPHKQIHPKK